MPDRTLFTYARSGGIELRSRRSPIEERPELPLLVRADLPMSFPSGSTVVDRLQRLGILQEITGKQRRWLFVYREYLDILNEGAEPLR